MSDETRARFLAAIAAKVGADRIEEAHVFPAIKQGGMESGVAVVAVRAPEPADLSATPPHGDPLVDSEPQHASEITEDAGLETPPHGDPLGDHVAGENEGPSPSARDDGSSRLTVYTAKYRLTVKGPERGKWEFAMQAEADAPLITVETVVRGVQKRSGDIDDPEKLTGDEFRAGLPAVGGSPA